ncbi:MAG: cation:dicarboxylase symporter family transporter, partial [Acidobacteria bacterium]|nr:cation:dicarboxylase symporter family transporter [Candidatus Sulfomarinibacter kjeldsenii]
LIGGIGKLTAKQSRLLLGKIALIMLALWALALLAVLTIPLALPAQTSSSFFSVSSVEEPPPFDFFGLFIPSNPFQSLAQTKVPAVVLFCLLTGIAIIGLRGKEELLRSLDLWTQVMSRVTNLVVSLSPVGVFFIAAAAAGTMRLEELARIQGYLVVFTFITIGLALGVLPALVSMLTPFRYRDIAPLLRSAVILAFATGKTLVVLPMLIDGTKKLFKEAGHDDEETASIIEVLVPLGYSFPHLGRILTTSFIPFAAWYIGSPLKLEQYPVLLGASLFVHFSNAPIAIPFLLDLMHLPNDLFQLFIVTGVLVGRLTDAVAASYLLVLAVIGACALVGLFSLQWRRVVVVSIVSVGMAVVGIGASRIYLEKTSTGGDDTAGILTSMQLQEKPVRAVIVEPGRNPIELEPGQSRLERMLERGVIRIGYFDHSLPFAFENSAGELVGFDIDLAHDLARDLGVAIEFVPVDNTDDLETWLNDDYFDVAVGGVADTVKRSRTVRFSEPYLFVTMALIVPDFRDEDFATLQRAQSLKDLTIGVPAEGWFLDQLQTYLPDAETVVLDNPGNFFEQTGQGADVDALLYSAEAGAAWTLRYPGFEVVTPLPRRISIPLVIPYAGVDDTAMDEFLDNWVMLRKNDGTVDRLFDYWILGEGAETFEPRWSVVRDVLHWTD